MIKGWFARLASFFGQQERDLHAEGELTSKEENDNEAEDRYGRGLDTASLVYAVTIDDVLAEVNEYTQKTVGMVPGEDIRQFYTDLEQRDALLKNSDQNKQTVVSFKMKSGEVRRFLCNMATTQYRRQKAYVLCGLDMEAYAAKKERETNRLKGKILTDVSHEIRTPMNGIIGMTDLLLGEKITGRQLQYVNDIKSSAESLLEIVNDILDYAKINDGKMQILPVDVELGGFLRNIVSMTRFSARKKGLEFISEINIKPPVYVRIDDERVKHVLLNLLSNAIKFTKIGRVTFCVKISEDSIQFDVGDTGIGVRQEDIPMLFTAFGQVDDHKTRGIKGTGLGLSISKKLIDLMEGNIWLESEYGVGSDFHVTIPYVPGAKAGAKAIDSEFEFIHAPTAHVLLVDDIQTNLTVTAGLLRLCEITADVAMSGMEAIHLVREKDYDIIFMDYMMPEMDGVEAMERIRGLGDQYAKLPIIALTAGAVSESRDFLLKAGMDGFLSKPLDKTALMDVLKKWIPANKIESVVNRDTTSGDKVYSETLHAVSMIEDMDIQRALSRISGMQDVLESSILQVAKSIDGYLQKMDEHLTQNKLKDFSVIAHGIKGALANIGAFRHSELAAELEVLSKAGNRTECLEKYAVFADTMMAFGKKLNAIFVEVGAKDRPQGDRSMLIQKAKAVISKLEEYEFSEARACINEMLAFTYDEPTDKLMNDIKDAVSSADYTRAIALLSCVD